MAEAATAVDFSTVDKQNRFVISVLFEIILTVIMYIFRRYLAIGLETGEILVYSNTVLTTDWRHQLTVNTGCEIFVLDAYPDGIDLFVEWHMSIMFTASVGDHPRLKSLGKSSLAVVKMVH